MFREQPLCPVLNGKHPEKIVGRHVSKPQFLIDCIMNNADIEMRWVTAWNDLFDIIQDRPYVLCLLPDGSVVDVEQCKAWLQDSVYAGYMVRVEAGYVLGKLGVIASRQLASSPEDGSSGSAT